MRIPVDIKKPYFVPLRRFLDTKTSSGFVDKSICQFTRFPDSPDRKHYQIDLFQ